MQKTHKNRSLQCIICAFIVVSNLAFSVQPHFQYIVGNQIVTTTADSGLGSLRQAIIDISSGGTITFDPSLSGQTILLTSYIEIDKNVTIDGSGLAQHIRVSGDHQTLVFAPHDAVVNFCHFDIINGHTTGNSWSSGIMNGSTLTITDMVFDGNLSGYGAAINNDFYSTILVTDSTFNANSAGYYGGAIDNNGTLTITNSSFIGNHASHAGGAIDNAGTLTITNSTFSGNTASNGGGAIDLWSGGSATLTHNTIAQNSDGIWLQGGTLKLRNNIIANNGTANFILANGATLDSNYNLSNAWGGFNGLHDLTGNPMLGPLGDHGGKTQTYPLLPGSPAINTANPGDCQLTDQRGISRPQNGGCDMGSFELIYYSIYLPNVIR